MKTSTKVLIGVGILLYIRHMNANAAAAAQLTTTTPTTPRGGSWLPTSPVTPTFQGAQAGYGTSPIGSLLTRLLGGTARPVPVPPSASAPVGGANMDNDPYGAGSYSGDAFGQAGVPGTYIDPTANIGNTVSAADPAILMMPIPYGDGVLWTPSPSVAG